MAESRGEGTVDEPSLIVFVRGHLGMSRNVDTFSVSSYVDERPCCDIHGDRGLEGGVAGGGIRVRESSALGWDVNAAAENRCISSTGISAYFPLSIVKYVH